MDAGHRAADKELRKIKKQLRQIYKQAADEIEAKSKQFLKTFQALDEQKQKLVEAGKLSKDEYQNWRRTQLLTGERYKILQENAARELHNANLTAYQYINGRLPSVYAANYNYSAGQIEIYGDNKLSFRRITSRQVEGLVKAGDKSLLPSKKLDKAKDIPWNMRKVNSAAMQGIIQGEAIPDIARRIASVTNANNVSSVRAARTLVNGAENKARHDAALNAEAKGVIMGKCWICANDERSREWHKQAFKDYGSKENAIPIDEPFIVDDEEMQYPGDPAGSPSNVYNCRCTHKNVPLGFKSILPENLQGKIKVEFR